MCLSQPRLVLSHTPRSPKWAVSSLPFSLLTSPSCILLFSDVSPTLRLKSDLRGQVPAVLQTTMAASGRQWRQRSISSSRQTSRQKLWERAPFDMRISFCKHLEQSVSGYWHPGVLLSHNFRWTQSLISQHNLYYRIWIFFECTHDICLAALDKAVPIKFSKLVYIHMRSPLNYWLGEKCEVGAFVYLSLWKGVSCSSSSSRTFSVWVSVRCSQMESDPWQAAPY